MQVQVLHSNFFLLPDQMLGRVLTYFHHHRINPLIQERCIVGVDTEYKHVTRH